MSRTEDYLDSLLNNVTPERKAESKRKRRKRTADFEEDFEQELSGVGKDGFISDFEADLEGSGDTNGADDSFFDDLEGIINNINEQPGSEPGDEPADSPVEPEEDGFEINTLADDTWTEEVKQKEEQPKVELVEDMAQLDELLEEENSSRKEKPDKKKKTGFFKKLGSALFGEDEDELPQEKEGPAETKSASEEAGYSGLDDEQLQILQELDMAGADEPAPAPTEKQKGKKKKEKKMKKDSAFAEVVKELKTNINSRH